MKAHGHDRALVVVKLVHLAARSEVPQLHAAYITTCEQRREAMPTRRLALLRVSALPASTNPRESE